MSPRRIVTGLLLTFVAASVAVLVYRETRGAGRAAAAAGSRRVVAYYLHGTARCPTCRKFEAYGVEALNQAFSSELAAGTLEWRVVNIEEPGNEHFVDDFSLTTKAIVLAELDGERTVRWKNLDRIWKIVRDKPAFVRYVQDETRAFLAAR